MPATLSRQEGCGRLVSQERTRVFFKQEHFSRPSSGAITPVPAQFELSFIGIWEIQTFLLSPFSADHH